MMVCPQTIYEHLKGKSDKQILRRIHGLQTSMRELKHIAEHPNYKCYICPSEETQIDFTREYIVEAKRAYAEAGGEYVETPSEVKARQFQKDIPLISRITYTHIYSPGIIQNFMIDLTGEALSCVLSQRGYEIPLILSEEPDETLTKERFLILLKDMHIGEWMHSYRPSRYGIAILDGEQWEIKIEYVDNRKPVCIYGDNGFPYNFHRFGDLFEPYYV